MKKIVDRYTNNILKILNIWMNMEMNIDMLGNFQKF